MSKLMDIVEKFAEENEKQLDDYARLKGRVREALVELRPGGEMLKDMLADEGGDDREFHLGWGACWKEFKERLGEEE